MVRGTVRWWRWVGAGPRALDAFMEVLGRGGSGAVNVTLGLMRSRGLRCQSWRLEVGREGPQLSCVVVGW